MRRAVGYIRRSTQDQGGHVSREEQEQALKDLAAKHEVELSETFIDWGKTGGGGPSDALTKRPGFRGLVRAVESGEVSHVFAVGIDRLGRSQNALGHLWAACQEAETKVVTTEGDMSDGTDPATVLLRGMLALFAEYYLVEQKRKNKRAMDYCRHRGDRMGQAPFGYEKRTPKKHGTERVELVMVDQDGIEAVLAAYRDTGQNYRQAAKRLNDAGHPRPVRADKWYATSVAAVVQRHAPEEAKKAAKRRERQTIPRLFRKLLRCRCGSTMTPTQSGRSWGYLCPQGHHDARHPRPVVISERKLRPWIEAEADRLVDRDEYCVEVGEYDNPKLRHLIAAARDAGMDEDADRYQAQLDAEMVEHGERVQRRLDVPDKIDWDRWSTEDVNRALLSLWDHVELGPDLLPTRAIWRIEEWRRASAGWTDVS